MANYTTAAVLLLLLFQDGRRPLAGFMCEVPLLLLLLLLLLLRRQLTSLVCSRAAVAVTTRATDGAL